MKNYIHKILAGIIAVAMVFGNFAGLGVAEVEAASDILKVRVLDENNAVVKDLLLVLVNDDGEEYEFDNRTDEKGEASYEVSETEMYDYYIKPEEGSGYKCEAPIEVTFGQNGIEKVNKYDYSGDVKDVYVVSTGEGQTKKPHIDGATSSIAEASWKGENAIITVTGVNLPEKLSYQIWYRLSNGREQEADSIKSVVTTGSDTKRQFEVSIPAVSKYPNAVQWIVKVIELENPKLSDAWQPVNIGIKKDTVTEETKTALNAAINEIKNLTESDYTVKSWNTYKTSIDAASALLIKQDATNTECQAAIQAIKKAKERLVLKSDTATQETKNALQAAVNGTAGINEADYTSVSWKAFSTAVANAKSLLKDEDATEVQCKAAIEEIERTKAALVIAKINVSKITITGASKKLAVGKRLSSLPKFLQQMQQTSLLSGHPLTRNMQL